MPLQQIFEEGKLGSFISLAVFNFFSCGVKALRIARVFLGRRSIGLYFFPLYSFLRFSFCFWCITMYTLAIDLRTTRILESLEAAPPVTVATLSSPNSVLSSSSCLVSSSFFLVRRTEHLTLPILMVLIL